MPRKPVQGSSQRRLTDEERRQIVQLYQDGVQTDEIMKQLGVSRATVYYTLDKMGVEKDRLPRSDVPDDVAASPERTVAWALRTILQQQEEIGRLREIIAQRERTIEALSNALSEGHRSGNPPGTLSVLTENDIP